MTHLNLTRNLIGGVYESGALFSFAGQPEQINIRVGISFVSEAQACANAESEVGAASFDEIVARSKALWNEKLSKIEIDLKNTPANVTELLYSSLYRASLTPVRARCQSCLAIVIAELYVYQQNNATDETQGPFANTPHPYFDSLYCR